MPVVRSMREPQGCTRLRVVTAEHDCVRRRFAGAGRRRRRGRRQRRRHTSRAPGADDHEAVSDGIGDGDVRHCVELVGARGVGYSA